MAGFILMIAVGAGLVFYQGKQFIKRQKWLDECKKTSGEVIELHEIGIKRTDELPDVIFHQPTLRYSVAGIVYEIRSNQPVEFDSLKIGQSLTIAYHPQTPNQITIPSETDSPGCAALASIGIGFLLLGMGLLFWIIKLSER